MRLYTDDRGIDGQCVFTLGMFDGMHVAHARLLRRAKQTALEKNLPLVVTTFRRNPLETLSPGKAPRSIQTNTAKLASLAELGVDYAILREFDSELADVAPVGLLETLAKLYHPADWFVGFNNTFGKGGAGTPALLCREGGRLGFRAHVMPAMVRLGEAVSSSRIRAALMAGDISLAEMLLGRSFAIKCGIDQRGVVSASDRLVVPAPGMYNVLLGGEEFALKLIPQRLGPPAPPTDSVAPIGRVISKDGQPMPSGVKTALFLAKVEHPQWEA